MYKGDQPPFASLYLQKKQIQVIALLHEISLSLSLSLSLIFSSGNLVQDTRRVFFYRPAHALIHLIFMKV